MVMQKCESNQCHRTVHLKEVKMVKFIIWTFQNIRPYLFIWLCWVLEGPLIFVVVCGIFSFGTLSSGPWDLVP